MQRLTRRTEPVDQYLRTFQWNKVKYRADKPIADLIDSLQRVCFMLWIWLQHCAMRKQEMMLTCRKGTRGHRQ